MSSGKSYNEPVVEWGRRIRDHECSTGSRRKTVELLYTFEDVVRVFHNWHGLQHCGTSGRPGKFDVVMGSKIAYCIRPHSN